MDCASDYALAAFMGTLLALLATWVLTGRTDELRRGVRAAFGETEIAETYEPANLSDYAADGYDDDVDDVGDD